MSNKYEYGWELFVLLLRFIAEEKGITYQQIADETGFHQPNIARVFSLKYKPNLDMFIRIAKSVGVNFFFEDQDSNTDLNLAFEKAMDELGRRGIKKDLLN